MHPQMERLYSTLEKRLGTTVKAEFARFLEVTTPVLNHWEARGIPAKNHDSILYKTGVTREWLINGVEKAADVPPVDQSDVDKVLFNLRVLLSALPEDKLVDAQRALFGALIPFLQDKSIL